LLQVTPLLQEVGRVDFGKVMEIFGQFVNFEDGIALANRDAGTAADAPLWIDIKLCRAGESRVSRHWLDRVGLADIDTKHVFDALIGDNAKIMHSYNLLEIKMAVRKILLSLPHYRSVQE